MNRRLAVLPLVAATLIALAACAPRVSDATIEPDPIVTPEPGVSTSPDPGRGDRADANPDCVDGVVGIVGARGDVRFDGQCDRVEITGTDLDVDLERAVVVSVVVRGDRNDVEGGDLENLLVEGQENDLSARSIGSAELRGDRNELDVDDELVAVVVRGNENEIEARLIGTVDDSGQRNRVSTD